MVNYCCVQGCNRNSRTNKNLNFYSLPKDANRQIQWIILAGRKDLIERDLDKIRKSLRLCSRHFEPNLKLKHRYLSNDALPSKNLPGSTTSDESDIDSENHSGIVCNNCSQYIFGFRYKCVSCDNYDLCQRCEMNGCHPQHYMLRIPKSIKFKLADNLVHKWQKLFKAEHVVPNCNKNELSSDDEPVTKYIRVNDNNDIDLPENVKNDIQTEIDRAIQSVEEKHELSSKESKGSQKVNETGNAVKQVLAPELEFADVNEYDSDIKVEEESLTAAHEQPAKSLYYMKLSGDLGDLMIELAPRNVT